MNRINTLFQNKLNNILSVYFTAGYPQLNDTTTIIQQLSQSGADLIEIGIPFSDPLADGETIQKSSEQSLQNGMSLEKLFKQLKDIRKTISSTPLILMGYLNTILHYDVEKFCKRCKEVGIDGTIIPDLPIDEYIKQYQKLYKQYNLKNIFLITPQTSEERIRYIDKISDAFIYLVSSASTTGTRNSIEQEQEKYFQRIQAMELRNPQLIGFGISNNQTFKKACKYTSGAIIGSAFIKILNRSNNLEENIKDFVNSITQ